MNTGDGRSKWFVTGPVDIIPERRFKPAPIKASMKQAVLQESGKRGRDTGGRGFEHSVPASP